MSMEAEHRCYYCGLVWWSPPGPHGGCPKCGCLYSVWLNMSGFGVYADLLASSLVNEARYKKMSAEEKMYVFDGRRKGRLNTG